MAVTKEESTSAVTRPYDGGDFYRNSVPLCNCSAWKTLRRLWERCRSRSRHRLREFREPIENHRDHAACRVTHGADESNVPPSGEGYKVHLKAPDSSEWFRGTPLHGRAIATSEMDYSSPRAAETEEIGCFLHVRVIDGECP